MSPPSMPFDYIICGGGTVGCVLASRLSLAGHNVALLEAGPEEYPEMVMNAAEAPKLHGSEYEYNYHTTKQTSLGDRALLNFGGKLLSGSTGVNYGSWTRGHSADYDAWAHHVGDERWSYHQMLPYFMKVETHYNSEASKEVHGFNGPVVTTAGARHYPLRQAMYDAYTSSGIHYNPDGNSGDPFGLVPYTESWKNGRRQLASKAYDLSKATVLTNHSVAKIVFEGTTATGVETVDGNLFAATKEVIVCCGALKTPQLLLLSGIGPVQQLKQHGIPVLADLPVGENLHDHLFGNLFWELRAPENGLAVGSSDFNDPVFFTGNPMEWLVTASVPQSRLENAIKKDQMSPDDPLVSQKRAHLEIMTLYAPIGGPGTTFELPFDGTYITTLISQCLPSSRGTVSLASTDPLADPIIDPCYFSTELDREILRTGFRIAIAAMETSAARVVVAGESPPPGMKPLTSGCEDAAIDERVQAGGNSIYQNAGTAAMGTVVDTHCRVKGMGRLRVCDASVFPMPLSGHYQGPLYAFGESMADLILENA